MATLSSPRDIILLLLSFFLFPFIIHGAKENHKHYTLIQKTCKIINTELNYLDYDFCISALQARPAKECATLRDIGMTCINLVMNNVTDTRRHIRGVMNSGKVQHWVRRCVDECYDLYDLAVDRMGDALKAFKHKEYMEAEDEFSMVDNSMQLVEELFKVGSRDSPAGGCGGGVSPFSARNNDTTQLCGMGMLVMNCLRKGNCID
ncbi:PREDICTED: putative invertase inhibitor [Ipomoea nil]|uniref:putative invertase inhibitor n=1 Tax=Ipomoea nil TaxID=35883 RepID=UPI0009017930|nr:PREDICTED: putative invertase inhibitor [Ipomoea nil]